MLRALSGIKEPWPNPTDFVVVEPYNEPVNQTQVITVAKAILQYGRLLGVVGIDIEASKIASQMLAFTNNISKYLLNRDGVIILSGSGCIRKLWYGSFQGSLFGKT